MIEDNKIEDDVEGEKDEIVAPSADETSADEVPEDAPEKVVSAEIEDNSEQAHSSVQDLVKYDPIQRYLAEIRHIKPLDREEEHELAVRYRENEDADAGYQLVLANLRLVVMIAREYQRNVQNALDLIQEGNIGLLEAVKQYDPYKGIRFPSYAVYWIRAYMLRYLINNVRLVKIGTTQAQRKLFFNLQKEKERLEAQGFVPEAKLLADRLKVKVSEVIEMEQRLQLPDLSVDAPVGATGERMDFHSILPSSGPNTEELVGDQEFVDRLHDAVDEFKETVDPKERAIIEKRLFTEEPATLQDIAEEFQLSRERIRQIESGLKIRLKQHLSKKLQLGESGDVEINEAEIGKVETNGAEIDMKGKR